MKLIKLYVGHNNETKERFSEELITDEADKVKKLKADLLTKLNQESILLTRTNLNAIEF